MDHDFLIVGAGMAGASAGFELAAHGTVALLERESQPGYHSTGRSAALYTENYGNPAIRALTLASRAFFETPPAGFADHPLLAPRGVLAIARPDQSERFTHALAEAQTLCPDIVEVSLDEAVRHFPALDTDHVARAFLEPDARDMDVHAIHQGFLRGLRARGGTILCDVTLSALAHDGVRWTAETANGPVRGRVLVNAAGAWADEVAALAGTRTVGLVPKRRTALVFDPPQGADVSRWAAIVDIDESFYVKPDAGRLLGSPADETTVPPQDVQPEELDVALAVDRITRATTLDIRRVERKWAGLRSFVSDKTPVVGPAPDVPGFVWLAGQGGYGIMTAPAMGRVAAAAALGRPVPDDIAALGLSWDDLRPDRLWR